MPMATTRNRPAGQCGRRHEDRAFRYRRAPRRPPGYEHGVRDLLRPCRWRLRATGLLGNAGDAMKIEPSDIGVRRVAHQAMNTDFEIFCVHADGDYAQQACWAMRETP